MRRIEAALRRVAVDLGELDRGFALMGGLAVRLVASRGYARGRELEEELARAIAELSDP